jgi:hypothetical protein
MKKTKENKFSKSKIYKMAFSFAVMILSIIFIVSLICIRNFLGEPLMSAKFKVYNELNKNYINYFLRIIPKKNKNKFIETEIQSNGNSKLILVKDLNYSPPDEYYLFSTSNIIEFINKPYLDNGSISNQGIKEGADLALSLNLATFNKYIKNLCPNFSDNQIISKFCFFLSSESDTSWYKILFAPDDLGNLLNMHPLKTNLNNETESYIKNAFQERNASVFLCWFYSRGAYEFNYKVENKELKYIKSKFIGYLGNEIIPL